MEGAVNDYTSGAFDAYDKDDVAGLLENRLEKAKERLDDALEQIRALEKEIDAKAAPRKLTSIERELILRRESASRVKKVPLAAVADHIQHIARVAGIDHVCLGSDFDGVSILPTGLDDATKLPDLTAELLRRGMSEADVRKVLGENLLRVLEANE